MEALRHWRSRQFRLARRLGPFARAGHGDVVTSRARVVPGTHNVRDLGGLTGLAGRRVRSSLVYRGDYPAFEEHETADAVRSLGLRTVVDLRRGAEAAAECISWDDHGVAYYRCPIVGGSQSSWHSRYQSYLSHRPETVVSAVRHVLDPASHPVLFHCAAGKDRTGVVAALVLSVLGVGDEEIIEDYLLSATAVEAILSRLGGSALYRDELAGSTVESQQPQRAAMQALLAALADQGGGAVWLLDHGLTGAEIRDGRAALLEG